MHARFISRTGKLGGMKRENGQVSFARQENNTGEFLLI